MDKTEKKQENSSYTIPPHHPRVFWSQVQLCPVSLGLSYHPQQSSQAGTCDGGSQAGLPLKQGAPKREGGEWEGRELIRGELRGANELGAEPLMQAWASVTHEGIAVILLTLTLELLLKDGDCSGRFIENGPDIPRSPRLTTVPKVS